MYRAPSHLVFALATSLVFGTAADAQNPPGGNRGNQNRSNVPRSAKKKVVAKFDKDKSGWLDAAERKAAMAWLAEERAAGRGGRRRMRGRGRRGPATDLKPYKVDKKDAASYPGKDLYDVNVIRTVFLDFKEPNWAAEMDAFYRTDVDVPATLTVDGKEYPGVGVHFRGSSSYFTISGRKKKSMGVSMDLVDRKQRLRGYKTLNLLNGHADPSFMRTVLFQHIANNYVAVPRANFVHLVINGESWGLYINDQQLNKDFINERFETRKGARWKIPPNFNGEASLSYLGDDVKTYQTKYELKSAGSRKKAWKRLVQLVKTMEKSTPEELAEALPKILNVEKALWFLAIDNVFMDGDGYHYRGSDYALYLHPDGRFHLLFRDNNEAFNYGGGPGGFGGRGPRGGNQGNRGNRRMRRGRARDAKLDPLYLMNQPRAPLVSKVLAVPKWREQYLRNYRTLVDEWLDWKKVGPIVEAWRKQIEPLIVKDDKGLYGHEAFLKALGDSGGRSPGLKQFFDARRGFLINNAALKKNDQRK